MTIIDASAAAPTTAELAEPVGPVGQGPDYFAPGREVWSPALGCRARVVAKHSLDDPAGAVHTLAGFVFDAIPVPMPGERLRGRGHFIGWATPADCTNLTGLATTGVVVDRVVFEDPAEWDARQLVERADADPIDVQAVLTLLGDEHARGTWLEGQVGEQAAKARLDGRREAEEAAQRRLEALVGAAHEWADEHGQCERFDEFCLDHGLPQREREYEVTAHLTVSVPVRLMVGRAEDDVSGTFDATYDEDDLVRMICDGEIDYSDVVAVSAAVDSYDLA